MLDMTTNKGSLCEPADPVVLQILFVRQAAATSDADSNNSGSSSSTSDRTAIIIGLVVGLGLGALLVVGFFMVRRQWRGDFEDLNYPCIGYDAGSGNRMCDRHRCVHPYVSSGDTGGGGG